MKRKHLKGNREHARGILTMCNISVGQNFHTLSPSQVDRLLEEADRWRYQKPKNANGSRGRYFHDMIQRRAQMKE